jgi:hypothetical protein
MNSKHQHSPDSLGQLHQHGLELLQRRKGPPYAHRSSSREGHNSGEGHTSTGASCKSWIVLRGPPHRESTCIRYIHSPISSLPPLACTREHVRNAHMYFMTFNNKAMPPAAQSLRGYLLSDHFGLYKKRKVEMVLSASLGSQNGRKL